MSGGDDASVLLAGNSFLDAWLTSRDQVDIRSLHVARSSEFREALPRAFADFLLFGWKQLRACVFAGSFFAALVLSRHVPLGTLARYDFVLLAAVAIQALLLL